MKDNHNGYGREPPRTVEAQKRLVDEWLKEIPRAEFETPQLVRLRKFLFAQVQDLIENWATLGIEDQFKKLQDIAIRSSIQPESVQEWVGKILGQKRILSQKAFNKLVKEVKSGRV